MCSQQAGPFFTQAFWIATLINLFLTRIWSSIRFEIISRNTLFQISYIIYKLLLFKSLLNLKISIIKSEYYVMVVLFQ